MNYFKRLAGLTVFMGLVVSYHVMYGQKSDSIVVRPAVATDLLPALELDCRVCQQSFKPLFARKYPQSIGKDPDYYLSLDIKGDISLFYDCIQNKCSEKFFVAFDENKQQVAGLIVFHQENESLMEIDLILVDTEYRRMGVGKRLVQAAKEHFNSISKYGVYVFSQNEDALAFYISQGFKIVGPGPQDKITAYGLSYADLIVYCTLG